MAVYKTQRLGDSMIISFAIRDLFSAFAFTLYHPHEANCADDPY